MSAIVSVRRGEEWIGEVEADAHDRAWAVMNAMATAMGRRPHALALGVDVAETDSGWVVTNITHEPARIVGDSSGARAFPAAEAVAMAAIMQSAG